MKERFRPWIVSSVIFGSNGLPMSVYLDRHTTYKSTAKASIEEVLNE